MLSLRRTWADTSHINPVGVEECALGRQLSQRGHPVNAWFCNQQKTTEITRPAQPTPGSPEARATRELEIFRIKGPPWMLSKQWWQAIPTAVSGPVFNFPAHYRLILEHKVRELLAPLLPVFAKPKSGTPIFSSYYYSKGVTIIISYSLKKCFSSLSDPVPQIFKSSVW